MIRTFNYLQSLLWPRGARTNYGVYDITALDLAASDISSSAHKVINYPTSKSTAESPETVYSSLAIVYGSKLSAITAELGVSKWSILGHGTAVPEHYIILKQQTQKKKEYLFLLAVCHLAEKAEEILQALDETLRPLLRTGTILFSKSLLEALVVPTPCPAENLTRHLIELMEHKTETFSYWYKVAEAINSVDVLAHYHSCTSSYAKKEKEEIANFELLDSNVALMMYPEDQIPLSFKALPPPLNLDSISFNAADIIDDIEEFFTPSAELHNGFSFETETPLITSVSLGYSKSSLFLLLGGSDPNCTLPESGDTPLHIAADQGNSLLVKLLITFEADPRIVNRKGETAVQRALKAEAFDCASILEEVTKLLDDMENLPKERSLPKKKSQSLLSLDGGGVRAIMEIQVLIAIEKQIKKLKPQSPSLLEHFDYIAGTSGGAYIMFTTVYGKASLKTSRAMVFSALNKISSSTDSKERVELLENFLKEVLGEEEVMSEVQSPRVIVTGTLADSSPCKLHLMTNYGKERDGQLGPSQRKQWEAARITSAVPVYFGSFQSKFLDGGVMANNPTLDAITEVHNQTKLEGKNEKLGIVLSLGSGTTVENKSITDIDFHMPRASLSSLLELPKSLKGLKNLGEIILYQLTQSDGQEVERCKAWCNQIGANYYRMSPLINEKIALDETEITKTIPIMFDAQMHVLREAETINNIALNLISKS